MGEEREIIAVNVELGCDERCEDCERFFECESEKKWEIYHRRRMALARERLKNIRWKIAVASGKGGVGKSTVTANLAMGFALKGYKVGVLDHDFDGASIPTLLGTRGKRLTLGENGINPVKGLKDIAIVSTGLLPQGEEVLTWFHDMRRNATEEFLADVNWGKLDILLIDLPPGTSSDAVNLLQYIPDLDTVVVVTVPSELSQNVARKSILLARKAGAHVAGIVENMSGAICPHCKNVVDFLQKGGGEKIARELGVPLLERIPMEVEVSKASDEGIPVVFKYPESEAAKRYMDLVEKLEEILKKGAA